MSQQIAVIQYNAGNIHSVLSALHRLGFKGILTDNPEIIKSSDKVIFPGVGEARSTMNHLREKGLDEIIKNLTQPVLGICLGMQLLCRHSEEGNRNGLGLINADVVEFKLEKTYKVPHMGWNQIEPNSDSKILTNLDSISRFYFVHSYYVKADDTSNVLTYTDYGYKFASGITNNDNVIGVQFHPEKSHKYGVILFQNFIEKY
jgi:glutamine amidotransferase